MKKNDWILIGIVLAAALAFLGVHFLGNSKGEGRIEVQADGQVIGTYPLTEERTVEIGDTNRLEIADGAATMIWADCPDQVCVRHKSISRVGESIICLPNQVVIAVIDGEKSELDAVAN